MGLRVFILCVCVSPAIKPDSSGDVEKLDHHLGVSQRSYLSSGPCVGLDAACVSALVCLIVGLSLKIKHSAEADTKCEM